MGTDAHLFTKDPSGLPVYEGRMISFYDHRAKNYISGAGKSSKWTSTLPFDDPVKGIRPQWYIPESSLPTKLERSWTRYRVAWQRIANPRRSRCLTALVIPRGVVCGDSVFTLSFPPGEEWRYPLWLAQANTLLMDYIARRRVALNMTFTTVNTLPFVDLLPDSDTAVQLIDRVLRLTCVSPELNDFRTQVLASVDLPRSLGTPPASEEADRARLSAEIDALIAKNCFDLTRKEYEHILDDFAKLRELEEKPAPKGLGEYRTKRLALEAFDELSRNSKGGG